MRKGWCCQVDLCGELWVTCCKERYGRGLECDVLECCIEIWLQDLKLKEIWV